VGRLDLRVLRRNRRRRHGRGARRMEAAAGNGRARLGGLRDPRARRRRQGLPAGHPGHGLPNWARPISSTRATSARPRRTAARASSPSATSATSTTRNTCSCAIARTT
jgi:hypothetical protein